MPRSTPEPSTDQSFGSAYKLENGTATRGDTIPRMPRPTITVISQARNTVVTRAVNRTPRKHTSMKASARSVPMMLAASAPLKGGTSACRYCVPMIAVIGTITTQAIV